MAKGYLPTSLLQARFDEYLFTPSRNLQNFVWILSGKKSSYDSSRLKLFDFDATFTKFKLYGGGQGGCERRCERRSEVFVKIIFFFFIFLFFYLFFFFGGGGGLGGEEGGQDGCEQFFFGGGGGGGVGLGGSGGVDVNREVKFL